MRSSSMPVLASLLLAVALDARSQGLPIEGILKAIGESPVDADSRLAEMPVPPSGSPSTVGRPSGAFEGVFSPGLRETGQARFVVATESPELVKVVAANLAVETGMSVVAERLTGPSSREVLAAAPAGTTGAASWLNGLPAEKFDWIDFSGHIEGGPHIADGGAGITLVNGLLRVAGDVGVPAFGYSVTVSPLAPFLRRLRVQPTLTRKYFNLIDLQGEDVRATITKAKYLYGVTVRPFGTGKVGFYAQAGRGEVTTERWLDAKADGSGRELGIETEKKAVFVAGAIVRF